MNNIFLILQPSILLLIISQTAPLVVITVPHVMITFSSVVIGLPPEKRTRVNMGIIIKRRGQSDMKKKRYTEEQIVRIV